MRGGNGKRREGVSENCRSWRRRRSIAGGGPGGGGTEKKEGRSPCDLLAVMRIVLYGYMEGVYSIRGIAKAGRPNINFMWFLNGNPLPPTR
jgi:hypothetical protein